MAVSRFLWASWVPQMKRTEAIPYPYRRRPSMAARLTFRLLALITAVLVLLGCGSGPSSPLWTPGTGTAAPFVTPNLTAAPTATPAPAFPVTVTAENGAVTIPASPKRIVSMSATATQMLYAIGAGPQVVAVDKYSTDPPNAPRTSFTGSETSAEGYMTFHPDLVVVAFDTGHNLVAQLKLIPQLLVALGRRHPRLVPDVREVREFHGSSVGRNQEPSKTLQRAIRWSAR